MTTIVFGVHEPSGDLAAAELMTELKHTLNGACIRAEGLGGPQMRAAGVELWEETTAHALMGFVEVLREIPRVLRHIRHTAERIAKLDPAVVVLVDAPDYNIRLAKQLRRLRPKLPIVYFICPQIWAWRVGRVSQLRKYFDLRLCILPFEPQWYAHHYTAAYFIGHPSVSRIRAYREQLRAEAERVGAPNPQTMLRERWDIGPDEPVVAILPGSRRKEIKTLLTIQLAALRVLNEMRKEHGQPAYRAVISGAPSRTPGFFETFLNEAPSDTRFVHPDAHPRRRPNPKDGVATPRPGNSFDACVAADLACVCSGTASVETALLGTPQVVVYRGHPVSWFILMRFVQVKFASIVNITAGREIARERLQHFCTPHLIAEALMELSHPERMAQTLADYAEFQTALSRKSHSAAALIAQRFLR